MSLARGRGRCCELGQGGGVVTLAGGGVMTLARGEVVDLWCCPPPPPPNITE